MSPTIAPEARTPTILIVEDEAGPRDALKMILRPFFHLQAVGNALAALRLLKEQPVDLVTLDLKLPDQSGMELLREIKLEHEEIAVVIVTGYGSMKSALDGLRYGAAGYLLKPFNVTELVTLITQALAKKRRLDELRRCLSLTPQSSAEAAMPDLADAWRRLSRQYAETQTGSHMHTGFGPYSPVAGFLSDALEATHRDLFNHASRVSFYAARLGDQLRLADSERVPLALGALLHDIGLVGIVERGPGKAMPLDARFSEEATRHTEQGASMLASFELPVEVRQIVTCHHERFDGSGFPEGLQGEDIPRLARIVALAQEFDQMMIASSLHATAPIEDAIAQLRTYSGTYFDPTLIEPFACIMRNGATALSPFAPAPGPALFPET